MTRNGFQMNIQYLASKKQQGAALLIGLVFLVILTIAGVSMMNSSVQDEKMTGNARRSVDAFVAAEAGMYHAADLLTSINWFKYICDTDGNLVVAPGANPALDEFPLVNLSHSYGEGGKSGYEVSVVANGCVASVKNQSLMDEVRFLSIGHNNNANGRREIAFTIKHSGSSLGALDFPLGTDCSYGGFTSNAEIDGDGGPSMTATQCADDIEDGLAKNTDDNYLGPIANVQLDSTFRTEKGIKDFYDAIKAFAENKINSGTTSYEVDGINVNVNVGETLPVNTSLMGTPDADDDGKPEVMSITVVTNGDVGDAVAEFNGNDYGAGLLVIEGDALFKGTPNWDGFILVMGGSVEIKGAGGSSSAKEGLNGSLMVTNVADPNNAALQFKGGGDATYKSDCQLLKLTNSLFSVAVDSFPDECPTSVGGSTGKAYLDDWYEVVHD